MALDVNPGTSNYNLLPPIVPNTTASPVTPPEIDENGGAMSGLGGQAPIVAGAARPAVTGPATPEPHESVARHILDALGNASGPMGWAHSIIAGGLAGAANVGEAPYGAGALYGASRAAAGVQQFQRQKMLDQRQATLDQSKLEDEKMQRTLWNAQVAGETQRQQEAAELFK